MNDQQPSQDTTDSATSAGAPPAGAYPALRPYQGPALTGAGKSTLVKLVAHVSRRTFAVWGGVLAGLGFGIGLALLMHVIEQMAPARYGGIAGNVWAVLLLAGPVTGLGLGIAAAALVPDSGAGPVDQPTAPPG